MCWITVHKESVNLYNDKREMVKMMKVAFVCDTGTGLTPVQLEEYGVYGAPLQITVDNTTKLEGVEISVDEVYGLMQQGKMLKTSLASAEECEKLFTSLKAKGYEMVFAVPICSGLSGTINLMRLTAENVGLKFDYYDCHCTAILERYLCIRAKELYEQGKSFDEIKMILEKTTQSANTLIVPDDLQHLSRGGRLTPMAAALGGLLKIKPILQINARTQGKIDVLDKVRTSKRAMQRCIEIMQDEIEGTGKGYSITVAHVVCEEAGLSHLEMCKKAFPDAQFKFIKLVSVVGVHTGCGCIAMQYFKEY